MTPNKHYNSYKEGLDLEFLREYWEEYVEERTFERSKTLKKAGTHPVNIRFMLKLEIPLNNAYGTSSKNLCNHRSFFNSK